MKIGVRTFLGSRFRPSHRFEIRAIHKPTGSTRRFWETLHSYSSIEPTLPKLDALGWDIYCSVNPRSGRGSSEEFVQQIVCFHADLDGEGPDETSDDDASRRKSHREGKVPPPSIIVGSGRGQHLYWILREPVAVTDLNRAHLVAVNRGLVKALGGDTACCDLSRILRIPGFHNHKREPATAVSLIRDSGLRYTVEELGPFAAAPVVACPSPSSVAVSVRSTGSINPPSKELQLRFSNVRRQNSHISRAWRGEIGDGSSDSRFILVNLLGEHGFTADEITSIVCARRWYNRRSKQVRSHDAVFRDVQRLLKPELHARV